MPQLVVNTASTTAGAGVPSNTGAAFVVGLTDEGPPINGPAYVACQSISGYVSAFGPPSCTTGSTNTSTFANNPTVTAACSDGNTFFWVVGVSF